MPTVGRGLVGWGKVGDLVGFPGVTVGIGVGSGLGAEVRMKLLKSSACITEREGKTIIENGIKAKQNGNADISMYVYATQHNENECKTHPKDPLPVDWRISAKYFSPHFPHRR